MLGAQLSDQGQSSGCEEHLLANLGRVGDISHCCKVRGRVIAAKEGVKGFVGLEVRLEGSEVVVERGRGGCLLEELNGL